MAFDQIMGLGVLRLHKSVAVGFSSAPVLAWSDFRVAIIDDQTSIVRVHSLIVKTVFGSPPKGIDTFKTLPMADQLLDQNLILLDQNLGRDSLNNDLFGSELALTMANDDRFTGKLVVLITSDTKDDVLSRTPTLVLDQVEWKNGALIRYLKKPLFNNKAEFKSIITDHFKCQDVSTDSCNRAPGTDDRLTNNIKPIENLNGLSDSIDVLISEQPISDRSKQLVREVAKRHPTTLGKDALARHVEAAISYEIFEQSTRTVVPDFDDPNDQSERTVRIVT